VHTFVGDVADVDGQTVARVGDLGKVVLSVYRDVQWFVSLY
jgi:hypothetical protein